MEIISKKHSGDETPETDFYTDLDEDLENEENDFEFDCTGDSKTQLD